MQTPDKIVERLKFYVEKVKDIAPTLKRTGDVDSAVAEIREIHGYIKEIQNGILEEIQNDATTKEDIEKYAKILSHISDIIYELRTTIDLLKNASDLKLKMHESRKGKIMEKYGIGV